MNFIADSIGSYIIGEIKKLLNDPNTRYREMRIILPSLPARVVLQVGKTIEEYRLHQTKATIGFIYKSAYALGRDWEESDNPETKAAFSEIEQNDWYDGENHLTKYRNIKRDPKEHDILAIVLVGFDRVTDQSSLSAFFRLDYETLWKRYLRGSFEPWLESRLRDEPVEFENDHLHSMDELLRGLVDTSLADLTAVSAFLERLNLAGVQDGRDALRAMVKQLDYFKLPCMFGLLKGKQRRKKSISHYLGNAIEFFNYSRYLDQPRRKKALEKIDKFMGKVDTDNFDLDLLGVYRSSDEDAEKSLDAFEFGLKQYIENNDSEQRDNLRSVDFVFLLDDVLELREPKGPKKTPKPKKLVGLPLEVVLRAVWLTLGDFKSWTIEQRLLATEELTDIMIYGDLFKHDLGGDDAEEIEQNGYRLLLRTIGGLDKYLEEQLAFAPDPINSRERTVRVTSKLCPPLDEGTLGYDIVRSSEPYLKFTVTVAAGENAIKRTYIWRFPQFNAYRTMADMFTWFSAQHNDNPIPVFTIPHFEELMLAKDEEEVNRILQKALQDRTSAKIFNLLDAHGIDPTDNAVALLKKLGYEYARFIINAHDNGIFAAFRNFPSLENAFRDAYSTFLTDPACVYSQVGPLLLKAFCILGEREDSQGSYWMWQRYEPAMVITPLHPALLEMVYHQHVYLCDSFAVAVQQGLRESGVKWFSERRWADIQDLAQIQWPLYGTLRNEEMILDTNVRSFDLIHLVGESPQKEATLTTRLLLRYDAEEDEEISDEDLFRPTRESRLVHRVLKDYWSLHPHADDGMAIAAYCSTDVQSVVAGVDAFLRGIFTDRGEGRPYTLSLTFFAENQDDTTVARWVREWRERWQAAEYSSKLNYYRACRISVAHRIITRERKYDQFIKLLSGLDADVAFLFQFIRAGAGGNQFAETDPYDHSGTFRMFPILEKMSCSIVGGGQEFARERIISNRQFKLSTLHAGVMARLKQNIAKDAEFIVMGRGDFSPWIGVVDELHRRSAWVVCVDPSVDERLIAKEDSSGKRQREIIGFGSGVGAHGEYNYTVSTEACSLAGVKKRISAHIAARLGPWDANTNDQIAESLTKEALHMAGMSLVKATGPSEYVRDFLAYSLVRKLLPRDPSTFCDELISLDAFRHWFDSAPNDKRPDLMRLRAKIEDGVFRISIQLLECKLAQQSDRYIEKAREQLENGLNHLISCFKPRRADRPEGIDDRPDQRYWWLQLHRLIASKGQVTRPELDATVNALERMSNGLFTIEWAAAAVTFWTDCDDASIHKDDEWEFRYEDSTLPIHLISTGRQFVRALCTSELEEELPIGDDGAISFSAVPQQAPGKAQSESGDTRPADNSISGGLLDKNAEEKATSADTMAQKEAKADSLGFIVSASVPDRIFLGRGSKGGRELYWEFGHPDLANRHMLIFGTSGMGKTYTIQALLCELGRHGQNCLIVDYTDGFHERQLESETHTFLKPTQHIVKLSKVPINPFRRQMDYIGDLSIPEDPSNTAQRVSGVFSEVYSLGDQQRSALYSAVKRGVEVHGDQMSLSRLSELLLEISKDSLAVSQSVSSVISKLQPFVDMNPFGQEDPESWEKLFTDTESRCHILQLAGYLKEASRLITEFSLIDLYWYYRSKGNKDHPKVIVLDEIQNLDQRLESPLGKFLTEGRKFGICLILATQTLSNFQKDERDRLFQAAHKLFFKPAETEIKSYAQILESATNEKSEVWIQRLAALKKGECYSLGPSLNTETKAVETKALRIKIDSLASRF